MSLGIFFSVPSQNYAKKPENQAVIAGSGKQVTFRCQSKSWSTQLNWGMMIQSNKYESISEGGTVHEKHKQHFSVTIISTISLLKIRDINNKALFAGRYICSDAAETNAAKHPGAQLVVLGEYFCLHQCINARSMAHLAKA